MEDMTNEEENRGFWDWLKSKFQRGREEPEEEEPVYKRRLLDGRVEKFLDQNFNSYVQEYGIITGLDVESYEERYEGLTGRIQAMNEYMLEADSSIGAMENDLRSIRKAAKKGGK